MGAVLSARDTRLGRLVAIKIVLPELATSSEAVARFLREARAAAAIRGEHVARILEVALLEDGAPYIAMEHLVGSDLAEVLRNAGALSVADAVDYLLQACEAL